MDAHSIVSAMLIYLFIGAVIWTFLISPGGFDGVRPHVAIAAACGEIVGWPVIVWVIMRGCMMVDQIERERH